MTAVYTLGIMTGNSLDATDIVLTAFENADISDIAAYSKAYPKSLTQKMLALRQKIKAVNADMSKLEQDEEVISAINEYTMEVAQTVNEFLQKTDFPKEKIAAIGFHGQTCDHFPPSIAQGKPPYTIQIGNAQMLADLTQIPVIYDFRSDDIINGGEGAPLAPVHNQHLAKALQQKGVFPVAFCNAGNTGNIAIISKDKNGKSIVKGWDTGPFNHYTDYLLRKHKNLPYDKDGVWAAKGQIVPELLRKLFNTVAVNAKGKNFYLLPPPKSSDPSWYKETESLNCSEYSFEDTLRTVLYLSSYGFVHSLSYVPDNIQFPSDFLIFGGGWKNPIALADFKNLLQEKSLILPEHQVDFAKTYKRLGQEPKVDWSDKYGISGQYMEARIFADMAYCRIMGEPFTFPESSGCLHPVVGGIYVLPSENKPYLLTKLLEKHKTADLNKEIPAPKLWNRAVKGWQQN